MTANEVYTGKLIKQIAGFFYVYVDGIGVVECKAKGTLRKDGLKPIVGDNVEIKCHNVEEKLGNITALSVRNNELIRPKAANVDQCLIVSAMRSPDVNYNLLDRLILSMKMQDLPCILCFNKYDLSDEDKKNEILDIYGKSGIDIIICSVKNDENTKAVKEVLKGKTTAIAGPSGVGKSTMINYLLGRDEMETGEISAKISRGKHTTRHAELFAVDIDNVSSFIMDTPGFSSVYVPEMDERELKHYYPEFTAYEGDCKFLSCMHDKEKECGVKDAVEAGLISRVRYENYVAIYEEIKNNNKY